MNVNGKHFRTIWVDKADHLKVINQLKLPHVFEVLSLPTFDSVCDAIQNMVVRGAGLIGATAGYGMWLAGMRAPRISLDSFDDHMIFQSNWHPMQWTNFVAPSGQLLIGLPCPHKCLLFV